jgi:hypothetical protein
MCFSEITEGPDDPRSRLVNLAFQLIVDGEPSQIAHIRHDLCVEAGINSLLCNVVWQASLQVGRKYGHADSAKRFRHAVDTAVDICWMYA